MKIIFYHDKRSVNDATLYYIKMIEYVANDHGIAMYFTTKLQNVKKGDILLTITGHYFCIAKTCYPFHKTIYWSQGVTPDEYQLMPNASKIKTLAKKYIDYIAINYSDLLFLISNKLLQHYRESYSYRKDNFLIIPCYNMNYIPGLAIKTRERYDSPTFVYAGNFSLWQCIEETLYIYKYIENVIPTASLTLLTKDTLLAEEFILKYELKNVVTKYVQLADLQTELTKYKYGFLIREDNMVNNVATPTKMNSYLASAVVPIYTDAVNSFVENIRLHNYNICLNSKDSIVEKATAIINFEKNIKIDPQVLDDFLISIFNNYYNDEHYKNEIKFALNKYILQNQQTF